MKTINQKIVELHRHMRRTNINQCFYPHNTRSFNALFTDYFLELGLLPYDGTTEINKHTFYSVKGRWPELLKWFSKNQLRPPAFFTFALYVSKHNRESWAIYRQIQSEKQAIAAKQRKESKIKARELILEGGLLEAVQKTFPLLDWHLQWNKYQEINDILKRYGT